MSLSNNLVKIGEAAKILGVSIDTLRRWEKSGKLQSIRTPGGTRLYSLKDLHGFKSNGFRNQDTELEARGGTADGVPHRATASEARTSDGAVGRDRTPSEIPSEIADRSLSNLSDLQSIEPTPLPTSDLTPPLNPQPLSQTSLILDPDSPSPFTLPTPQIVSNIYQNRSKLHHLTEAIGTKIPQTIAAVTLVGVVITSVIASAYLKFPTQTKQFFASAPILSPFNRLAVTAIKMTSPETYQNLAFGETPFVPESEPLALVDTTQPPTPNYQQLETRYQLLNQGQVLAESTVAHYLEINSDTQINGTLATQDILASGSAEISKALNVTGTTILKNTLSVTGATTLGATLQVTGTSTLSDLIASGQIKATGNKADTVLIQPTTDPGTSTKLFVVKTASSVEKLSITAGGDLSISGTGTIAGALTISGATTLITLTTSDLATLSSLKVTGTTNLVGAATLDSTLKVSGSGTFSSTLAVSGATTLSSTLAVTGATTLASTLAVTGAATFSSTINTNTLTATALTFSGNSPIVSSANNQLSLAGGVGIGYTGSSTPTFPSLGLAVNGSVGIGTTSPTTQLTVAGDANITGNFTISGATNLTGQILGASGSASAPEYSFTNLTNAGLWTNGNGILLTTSGSSTSGITVTSGGYLGVGVTSPNANFSVAGSAIIGSGYNGYAPPGNGLLVQGNVGISTSAPQGALDVNGTSFFRSLLTLLNGLKLETGPINLRSSSGLVNLNTDISTTAFTVGSLFGINSQNTRVGVGTTAPGSTLAVAGGETIGSSYSTLSAPTNGLYVQGNVGIGTTYTSNALFNIGNNAIIGTSYVQNQTAPTNGLLVQGNVGIGSTFTNTYTLSVGGNIGVSGHILPTGANYNVGSSGLRWDTGYFNTIDATTIAGVISGGSTNASDWTINADNATNDAETMSLAFERGTASPNAVLRWDVNAKQFNLNSGLLIGSTSQDSQITTNPYGIEFSSVAFDLTTSSNQHLAIIPNGTGNVGIGTSGPYAKLQIFGAGTGTGLGFSTLDSSGTQRFAILDNGNVGIGTTGPGSSLQIVGGSVIGFGSSSIVAPSNGLAVSGNIGIGTTTANYNLSVIGTTNITGQLTLADGTTSLPGLSFTADTNTGIFRAGTDLLAFSTAGSERLRIDASGNVGIGITNPGARLSIFGGVGIGNTGSGGFATSIIPNMGLAVQGNVGIGTTTANYNLSVVGTTNITGQLTLSDGSASAPGLAFTNDTNTGLFRPGTDALGFVTGGTERLSITAGGFIGIGVTNPIGALQVNGATAIGYGSIPTSSLPSSGLAVSGNVGIGTTTANFNLSVAGTGFFSGNVGIGATTSSNKLDVWGNQRITGTLTVDSTITTGGITAPTLSLSGNNSALTFTGTTPSLTSGSSVFGIFAGGNVGIGTTATLGSSFNINGNGIIGSSFIGGAAPSNGLGIQGNVGIGTTTANFNLSVIGTGFFSGNVGIGATTSSNKLDVWGNARITGTLTVDGSVGNLTSTGVFLAADGTASAPSYSFSSDTNTGIFRPGTDALGFTTGGTERLSITASGFVGIGVTNPIGAFQVNGAGAFGYGSIPTSSLPSNGLAVSGNVGIGTTSPTAKLHVVGNFVAETGTQNAFGVVSTQAILNFSTAITGASGAQGIRVASVLTPVTGNATIAFNSVFTAGSSTENVSIAAAFNNNGITKGNSGTITDAVGFRSGGIAAVSTNAYNFQAAGSPTGGTTINADFYTGGGSPTGTNNYGLYLGALTGAGTNNYGIYVNAPSGATTNVGAYIGGNVGIGFTSPTNLLQIAGDLSPTQTISGLLGAGGSQLSISGSSSSGLFQKLAIGVDTTNNFAFLQSGNVGTGNTSPLILNPAGGYVGIGTTSPVVPLQIQVNQAITPVRITNLSSTGFEGFNFFNDSNTLVSSFAHSNSGQGTNPNSTWLGTRNAEPLYFVTNGTTPRMTIDSTGNVGIGTTGPATGLHIESTGAQAKRTIRLAYDTSYYNEIVQAGAGGLIFDNSQAMAYDFRQAGISKFLITNVGNVGIGTSPSSPSQLFQVNTSTSNPFVVTSGGNVGIGTTSPGGLLDIFSGNTRLARVNSTGRLDLPVTGSAAGIGIGVSANDVVITSSATVNERYGSARRGYTNNLVPEFAGATLTLPVGLGSSGNMTADFCSKGVGGITDVNASSSTGCPTSADIHNFYQWVSTDAQAEYYDLWVRWQVPSDFSEWDNINQAGAFITGNGFRTTSSDSVAVTVYDTGGTARATSAELGTSSAIWNSANILTASTGTWTAGGYVTFQIRFKSVATTSYARVGELSLYYLSKFK